MCESCEVENKLHVYSTTGLSVLFGSESCFQKMKRSDPIDQVREYHLNLNPASEEMISDSVELSETEVCFLHVQLLFVLETIRTGAMRAIHIPVKTEETQRLRIKFVLYCPICASKLENQTSELQSETTLSNIQCPFAWTHVQQSSLRAFLSTRPS